MNARSLSSTIVLINALAVSAWALTVTPGRTEIQIPPGGTMKAKITATNETADRIQVEVSKKDWFVLPENKGIGVGKWLSVKGPSFFWLKPGQSRSIPIKVTAPKQAEGELVGMVSFAYQPEKPTTVTPMISVAVYTGILGKQNFAGKITQIDVHQWPDRVQVGVAVRSTGNAHLRPTGHVQIVDASGAVVTVIPINEGSPAYPGQERAYFGQQMALKLAAGRYVLKTDMQYQTLSMTAAKPFQVKADGTIIAAEGPGEETSNNPGAAKDALR